MSVREEGNRCELCNISTPTPADQIDHDASLMHHMKLDQFHNGRWVHNCKVCKIQSGKLKNYIIHMKGKKHEAKLIEEKVKWTGKSEFRTPKTFFLSSHERDNTKMGLDKNNSPIKDDLTKNRNNTSNVTDASVTKFNLKTFLPTTQEHPWSHQSYNNVSWSNQNPYSWASNNYNHQNLEPGFWNNSFDGCDFGHYKGNTWNFAYTNQWPNNINSSRGIFSTGLQRGYHNQNQTNNQYNSNVRVIGDNNQDKIAPRVTDDKTKKKDKDRSPSVEKISHSSQAYSRSQDFKTREQSSHNRGFNNTRNSYHSRNSSRITDSTLSCYEFRDLHFPNESTSKIQNEDPLRKTVIEESCKGQRMRKNDQTKLNFRVKKDLTTRNSSRNSSKSNSNEKLLSKKQNLESSGKFRRDIGKRVKDGNEPTKETSSHLCEKGKDSPDIVEMTKLKNSNDTLHVYFLSSDSDGEGHKSITLNDKSTNKDECITVPTSKNNKGEGGAKSLNRIIISRLVNHPCTPRQQMQLTKWLQSQTVSKNLILPCSNLPQSEENNALANVMSELPEDILNDLYEAIEENEGNDQPEMEVCLKSEPSEPESGNIPWVEFLKSLELNYDQENQDIVEENSNLNNSTDIAVINENDRKQENSKSYKENCTSTVENSVSMKMEPMDCEELEPSEVSYTSRSLPERVTLPNLNNVIQNTASMQTSSTSETETEVRSSAQPKPPPPAPSSERATPDTILHRSPSVFSCLDGSIDHSQKEINDWINKLPNANIPNCSDTMEQIPRESETLNKNPSQEIIDNLLYLNSQEEQLREESQKVEQVISQLYRLLEEWKNKRNEIVLQETTFRNKRLKLLESLKGAVSNEKTIPLHHETQQSGSNVQYLGTLESTLNFVQELGNDLGFNVPLETSQNVISSTNCEIETDVDSSSKSTKKKKKTSKKKNSDDCGTVKSSKKLKRNSTKDVQAKKMKKRKDEQTVITSTTKKRKKSKTTNDSQIEENMLGDYVSTVMPENLGISKPLVLSSSAKLLDSTLNENSNDILLEENTFGPISSHDSAVIDVKVSPEFIYSCSTDKTAKRTNFRDQTVCVTYVGHGSTVSSIKLYTSSSGDSKVFTSCHDSYLRCFNSETGECITAINVSSPIICMSLEWNTVFMGLQNGQIVPYNILMSKLSEPILGSDEVSIGYLYASNEGCTRLLFIVDYNGVVTIRNAMTGLFIRSLAGKVKPPCRITVHSSSVYVTTMEKTILIFDLMTGVLQRKVSTSTSSATGIKFQGDIAICCYLDGSIKCFTKEDWKLLCILRSPGKTMTMCMDLTKNWIFTGNKLGVIQGFKYDFCNIKTCKYTSCTLPFGGESNLKLHIEQTHFERTNFREVSSCPWENCKKYFKGQTIFNKKQHILSHL